MKIAGLLMLGLGLSVIYLVGFKCYGWADFKQELANFINLPIGSTKPGVLPNPAPCPSFNPFAKPVLASG